MKTSIAVGGILCASFREALTFVLRLWVCAYPCRTACKQRSPSQPALPMDVLAFSLLSCPDSLALTPTKGISMGVSCFCLSRHVILLSTCRCVLLFGLVEHCCAAYVQALFVSICFPGYALRGRGETIISCPQFRWPRHVFPVTCATRHRLFPPGCDGGGAFAASLRRGSLQEVLPALDYDVDSKHVLPQQELNSDAVEIGFFCFRCMLFEFIHTKQRAPLRTVL